jgi:hypothetical protein
MQFKKMKIINTFIKLYSHYSVPKPVFHSVTGKKSSSLRAQQEVISPQHAELINFIYECELHIFCLLFVNSDSYV